MTIVSLIVILPYLWMLSTSLKTPSKIFVSPPQWIPDPVRFENFIDLFTNGSYGLYLWNSFKVTFLTTVGTVIVSTLAGYALAKIKFPGRNFFFILFLFLLFFCILLLR